VLGLNQYITILAEPEPGHLTGTITVPAPPPAVEGLFYFQQFSALSARGQPIPVGKWPVRMEALFAVTGRGVTVLDQSVPAHPRLSSAPRPLLRGYHIRLEVQSGAITDLLTIDIVLGPNQRIVGGDGMFGLPTVGLIPGDEPIALVANYPRERGRYNYCRWDLSPLSAPPRPGTDEASC
jgi:hypothetical protein